MQARAGQAPHEAPLQFIFAVEHQHRCARQCRSLHAVAEVLAGEAGRSNRLVPHGAERVYVAALHRLAFGGDRAEHAAIAQQLQGVVPVVHAQVEQVAMALVQVGDGRHEQVSSESSLTAGDGRTRSVVATLGQQLGQRLGFQCLHRPYPAQQCFPAAVGRQGARRTTSTWPRRSSSALTRCDSADGLIDRRRAAASKLPSSSTAANAASCGCTRSMPSPLQFSCTG